MHCKGMSGTSMNMKRITPKMRAMASNGEYAVSKEEAKQIRRANEANKQKQAFRKAVHETTCEKLSKAIRSPITIALINSCTDFKSIRNGYHIKCIEHSSKPVIQFRTRQGTQYTFRVVE